MDRVWNRNGADNPVLPVHRWLSNYNRIAIGAILLYMVLSFAVPTTRDWFVWQESSVNKLAWPVFQLMFGITIFLVPVASLMEYYPRFKAVLDKLCNKRLIIGSGIAFLALCLILTKLHVPGWWWTWFTVGVQISIVLLAYLVLENRVSKAEAVVIGIGLMGISIGLWEIPYQVSLKLIHQAGLPTREIWLHNLGREILIELPLILGGIYILFLYRAKKIVHFNKWFWLLGITTVGLFAYWIASGFWIEMRWNWESEIWIQNPINMEIKAVYRASKVTLALALVALLLPRKEKT